MIVVTEATGKLGKRVVEKLPAHLGPDQIVASVRDPSKAAGLAARGVEMRRGDYADSASLVEAFAGATQVLLVSSNADFFGGDTLGHHHDAIDAAAAARVRRMVYTSHMGASAPSAFTPMRTHAATEAMLDEGGVPWTALRNGYCAETVSMLTGDAGQSSLLAAPQDGKVAWTTHDDLAAGAAAVLAEEGRFDGPTPPLTASQALDLAGIAVLLSETTGRSVQRRVIGDDDLAAGMKAGHVSDPVIDLTLGMYQASCAGEFAATDPTLGSPIGREPTMLDAMLPQQHERVGRVSASSDRDVHSPAARPRVGALAGHGAVPSPRGDR